MTSLSCGSDTQGSYPFSGFPSQQLSPAVSPLLPLSALLHDYPPGQPGTPIGLRHWALTWDVQGM